jgi:hypothetical protein
MRERAAVAQERGAQQAVADQPRAAPLKLLLAEGRAQKRCEHLCGACRHHALHPHGIQGGLPSVSGIQAMT